MLSERANRAPTSRCRPVTPTVVAWLGKAMAA
jgi:hypothetical protein